MSHSDSPDYRAEMGYSHRELLNALPSAVAPFSLLKQDSRLYLISYEDRIARLSLSRERIRKIASFALPVTDIVIEFENFDKQQHTDFIEKLEKYLHKGGG
jgi:hypothetical protein